MCTLCLYVTTGVYDSEELVQEAFGHLAQGGEGLIANLDRGVVPKRLSSYRITIGCLGILVFLTPLLPSNPSTTAGCFASKQERCIATHMGDMCTCSAVRYKDDCDGKRSDTKSVTWQVNLTKRSVWMW